MPGGGVDDVLQGAGHWLPAVSGFWRLAPEMLRGCCALRPSNTWTANHAKEMGPTRSARRTEEQVEKERAATHSELRQEEEWPPP